MDVITKTKSKEESYLKEPYKLILWNDQVNSFEHVIECLVMYLLINPLEAFSISQQVHYTGKAIIFGSSSYEAVEDIYKMLVAEGLTVSIQ